MKSNADIEQLAIDWQNVGDETECLDNLQFIIKNKKFNAEEVEKLKLYVVAVIQKEIELNALEEHPVSQTILNVSLRAYFLLIDRYHLRDTFLNDYLNEGGHLNANNECAFQVLYAALQTDFANEVDCEKLKDECVNSFLTAIEKSESTIYSILKALNLLLKRYTNLEVSFNLDQFYFCFETNINGMREETLTLFSYCCKDRQVAFEYFQVLLEFWPWTNRNKLYLLSCIFDNHDFTEFAELANLNKDEFFSGLRLSLSYKNLQAASQYVVNSLSKQNNKDILALLSQILVKGNLCELQNVYAQWFGRIKQRNEFFHLLKQEDEIIGYIFAPEVPKDPLQHFRVIVIFCMFAHQIFEASKLLFFRISTDFITNCFDFSIEAQLLIFRFFVDNISFFAIEDCMLFFIRFIEQNYSLESSQIRNTILGKIPNIINYIAKSYRKARNQECIYLEASIINFFGDLQKLINTNVQSTVYQPKIFALKLQQVLWQSLYATNVIKNCKNCSVDNNKMLGTLLIENQVFDKKTFSVMLMQLIGVPPCFDDAIDVKVELLKDFNDDVNVQCFELCRDYCKRIIIDECFLSFIYAKVALNIPEKDAEVLELFKESYGIVHDSLQEFKEDPFCCCKNKNHLYGYLSVLNEILQMKGFGFIETSYEGFLNMLTDVTDTILEMLNLANQTSSAASFQDMDESLEILVTRSQHKDDNHEAARKFLLMTFWYTLKATCDLAANMVCNLMDEKADSEDLSKHLDQCLQILVSVLTKCRHKGAIECAGVCIGKVTRKITSSAKPSEESYKLLFNCIQLLCEDRELVSTTRRGAGFSIMFLHILKNEKRSDRPLLKKAMQTILKKLGTNRPNADTTLNVKNIDCMEALTLHSLCVLVKDTELKEPLKKYQNDIILAAIAHIDNPEWTICNAALQLFGALVPKIVGQKTATELEEPLEWETSEVTYDDLLRKLPSTCNYILEYCSVRDHCHDTTTRSFILFLGFLAKIEHIRKILDDKNKEFINKLKEAMWSMLTHQCEKVRKLASICFVRLHEFRVELPYILTSISKQIFTANDPNLFQGLIFILQVGLFKLESEHKHTIPSEEYSNTLEEIKDNLVKTFQIKISNPYTLCKLLDLLLYLKLDQNELMKQKLSDIKLEANSVSYDAWIEKLQKFSI